MSPDAQLVIRTHRGDLDWLQACLQSARKYWTSSFAPVIVATPDCEGLFPTEAQKMKATIHYEPQWPDRKCGVNYLGLSADLYADLKAPIILITDSDCMFRKPVSIQDFMQDGKIIVRGEPWETVKDPVNQICIDMYRVFIRDSIGITATHETMREHPFVYWREDFAGLRAMIQQYTGRDLKTWITEWAGAHNSGFVSEFNLMGAYCLKGNRPYVVVSRSLWDDQKVRQFHSWSQTPYSCLEEVGAILA